MEQTTPLLYIQNWALAGNFSDSVRNRKISLVDMVITETHLYVVGIQLPFIATVLPHALGLVGALIAESIKKKALKKIRSQWLDGNGNFISDKYKDLSVMRIRAEHIQKAVEFQKRLLGTMVVIKYDGQKISIQNKKLAQAQFRQYIDSLKY